MFKKLQKRRGHFKGPLLIVLLCICLLVPSVFVFADTTDDDNYSNYDYYTLSSVASSTFSNAVAKGEVSSVFGNIPSNGAGALLGFCDENKTRGINILQILTSTSTAEYSYKSILPSMSNSPLVSNGSDVFAPYVVLGAVLSDCGLDSTGIGIGTSNMLRYGVGSSIVILYAVSMLVPYFFSIVISVLEKLNPFQFFATAGSGNMTNVYADLAGAGTTRFAGLTEFVRQWFVILQNMGVWVIAIFMAILVFTVLMNRKAAREASLYKRFLMRGAFIVFGIPLLGSTYTMVLGEMKDMVEDGNIAAAKVIASSFCDFGGFVESGMKFDGSIEYTYNLKTGTITAGPNLNPQSLCLAINMASNDDLNSGWAVYSQNATDGGITSMIKSMQNGSGAEDAKISAWVYDVLGRYMRGDKISGADFAGRKIGAKWLTLNATELEKVDKFVSSHSKVHDYDDNNGEIWNGDSRINPFFVSSGSPGPAGSMPVNGKNTQSYSGWAPSDMTIYNYLNTKFSPSKLTVYSSERTSSDAVREHHYSVNMAGTGFSSVIVFLTAVCLLLVDTVIGIYYAFGIVMKNLGRGMRLILSVPMAMLGSLQAIARIITYTVVMVLEVLGSIMAYAIITEFMYSLAIAFNEELATELAKTALIGSLTVAGPILPTIFGIITIIFMIWFLFTAIKLRKNLIRSLDQCAESVISKFVIGSPQPTGALSGKEMKQVGQLGATKNQSGLQRVGHALAHGTETAAHVGMTALMLSTGNIPGAANQAAKAVGGAKKVKNDVTEDGGSTADGAPASSPYEREKSSSGHGIESRIRPSEITGGISGVPSVQTSDLPEISDKGGGSDLPDASNSSGVPGTPKGPKSPAGASSSSVSGAASSSGKGITAVQNNLSMTNDGVTAMQGKNSFGNMAATNTTVSGNKNFGNGNNIQISGIPVSMGRSTGGGSGSGGDGMNYSAGMSGSGSSASGASRNVYGRSVTNGKMTSESNITVDEKTSVRRMRSMNDAGPSGKGQIAVAGGSASETIVSQNDMKYVENVNVSHDKQESDTISVNSTSTTQVMERRKTIAAQSDSGDGDSKSVSKSFGKNGKKWF